MTRFGNGGPRDVDAPRSEEAASSGPLPGSGPRDADDREGLDFLASVIDTVAEDLPAPAPESVLDAPHPPARGVKSDGESAVGGAGSRIRMAALAAGLTALILAHPAYLGLVRLPEVESRLAASRDSIGVGAEESRVSGPVEMVWLSPPRGGARSQLDGTKALELRDRGPAVWLLEVPMTARGSLGGGAMVELVDGEGQPARSWPVSAEALERRLAASDGIPLVIDTHRLEPGPYRLRVWPLREGEDMAGSEPTPGAVRIRGPAVDMALRLTAEGPTPAPGERP